MADAYIKLGQGLGGAVAPTKYAWTPGEELPGKKVRDGLGWNVPKKDERGLNWGINRPKPARVRINFEGGGSKTTFCDPGKLESVTIGGDINGQKWGAKGKYKNSKIRSVTNLGG